MTLLFRTRQFSSPDHDTMQYPGNMIRVFVTLMAIMVSPRIVYLVMIVRLSPSNHKIHVQIYKRRYLSASKATHFSPLSSQICLAGIRMNQHSQDSTIVLNGPCHLEMNVLEHQASFIRYLPHYVSC